MRPRASGNGEKGPTDSATAKPLREPGPGGDVAPRQGKEAIRFLEARPHPPCEAERTRSVASCALKGYAGKLGVWGGRRASSRAGRRGTCWGPLGSQSILRSVQVRETQAAGDLRRRWLPRAGANFVRCGRGRGWGLGTRYLGSGGPSTPAEARAAAPGPGAAWSSARGGPGPRLPGAAPAATLGRRAWLAPKAPLFPRRRRPTLAALPWLRLSALSGLSCARPGSSGPRGLSARRPGPPPRTWPELRSPRRRRRDSRAPAPVPFRSRRRRRRHRRLCPRQLPAAPRASERVSERARAGEEGGEAGGGRGRGGRGRGPPPGDRAPGGRPAIGGGTCHSPASRGEGARPQKAWEAPRGWSGRWRGQGPPEG